MMCLRIMLKPHALANSMSYLVRGRVGAGVKGRVGVREGLGLGLGVGLGLVLVLGLGLG